MVTFLTCLFTVSLYWIGHRHAYRCGWKVGVIEGTRHANNPFDPECGAADDYLREVRKRYGLDVEFRPVIFVDEPLM